MKKLIVFTSQGSLSDIMPEIGDENIEFSNIGELEKDKIMSIKEKNTLSSNIDPQEDSVFLLYDQITPSDFGVFGTFIGFIEALKSTEVYILYHLNKDENEIQRFNDKGIFKDIPDYVKIKIGEHTTGNNTYSLFGSYVLKEDSYNQAQVSEIISVIFENESEEKLQELHKDFLEVLDIPNQEEREQALQLLAQKRDEFLKK